MHNDNIKINLRRYHSYDIVFANTVLFLAKIFALLWLKLISPLD